MEEKSLIGFLVENAIKAENVKYPASERFLDHDKKPLEWELRVLTNDESDEILKRCKKKELTPNKQDFKIVTDNDKFITELMCACVVYPNLNDVVLQESYGAVGADDVLKKMLTPGEFNDLSFAVQEANGYKLGMGDKIKQAKN